MSDVRVERERRGQGAYWVHLYGSGEFTSLRERQLNQRLSAEARKWAAELRMTCGGRVSGGGQYGAEWRHSACYMFGPT